MGKDSKSKPAGGKGKGKAAGASDENASKGKGKAGKADALGTCTYVKARHILCEKQSKVNEAYQKLQDGWLNNGDKVPPTEFAKIKDLGAKAGVVLNPGTPLTAIEYVLDVVDLVLIMSVNPGFGGQSFIESQVKKISDLRRLCAEKGVNPWIEVDGGVGPKNAYKVIEAGANALVAGSAVFGAKDYAEAIKGIKESKRPVAVPA